MSRLARDGTVEPVSRDPILYFPVQLTTSRAGNFTRLIHTLAICVTIHTHAGCGYCSRDLWARLENTRLSKCVMFGGTGKGRGLRRGPGKRMDGVFWTTSELSISAPISGLCSPV